MAGAAANWQRLKPDVFLMRSYLRLFLLLALTAGLSACAHAARIPASIHRTWNAAKSAVLPSSRHKSKVAAAQPRFAAQTATLDVTFGLQVVGVVPLPEDFLPDVSRPPLWLRGGSEVGVIGTRGGNSMMLGFSGVGLTRQRIVIEDYGAGASGGRLLDVAANVTGQTLGTVVASASRDHLDVNLTDASNPGDVRQIARLEGEFDSAQLAWLSSGNIALAAQAVTPPTDEPTTETTAVPVGGLYMITVGQDASMRRLDLVRCPLSPLAFSPNDAFAVALGGSTAPPAIIDLHAESCTKFPSASPLQVLGWAPNSAAFLYRTADQAGVFCFDLLTGRSSIIAISSGAASYASDGTIVAFGSQQLSWRRAAAEPLSRVKAQIALIDPHQSLTTINSLGFSSQPALLAQSTMVFSQASNDAIIDTAIPTPAGLLRAIIEYSYPARAAFVLAHGEVQGPIAISWSPDGKKIAIVDGDATRRTLAVIAPPK